MILSFKFKYVSKNRVLENFLRKICEDFGIRFALSRDNNSIVTLYVEESEDRLHEFADYISANLPLSIFMKSSSVEVIDSIEDGNVLLSECSLALPFTKRALEKAKNPDDKKFYMNPFTPNEVGLTCKEIKDCSLELYIKGELFSPENGFKDIYKRVAELINENNIVKIKTPNGIFAFGKVSSDNLRSVKDFEIIPTDYSLINKMVVLKENELIAIASLEKPILEARVNMIYASKNILPKSIVHIRMPNTLLLQFICEELYKLGVEFIFKTSALDYGNEYLLNYNITTPEVQDISIVVLENSEIIITKGSGYASKRLVENLKKLNNPAISQFASVLKERNLFSRKVGGFYLSKENDDLFMNYDDENWILPLIKFPTFESVSEIFEEIQKSDENGVKLIRNYKKTFPEIYERAYYAKIPENLPKNIYSTLGFLSLILGYESDFKRGAEKIIENSESFGGQKGPRIDCKLKENSKLNSDFDTLKFVRSAISFKLAGVDDLTLSFGFFESLSYFISDIADSFTENFNSKKVALCGSMFGSKKFAEITCKNLLANHQIYFNQELPCDNI